MAIGQSSNGFTEAVQAIKEELRGKAAMANKRITRLENNGLTELSAYRSWSDEDNWRGGEKFTSAGTDYRDLQKELARVDKFLNNKSSLVREANKQLKNIADTTGIKYQKVSDLPQLTSKFFELASKAEQYLRNVQGSVAVQYQEIWQEINAYLKKESIDLNESGEDINKILEELLDDMESESESESESEGLEDEDLEDMGWFTVD